MGKNKKLTKKISVCLASYNGELYIKQQVESILKQLGKSDELIISDDGSTDNTRKILEDISDPRIKIVLNENEKGYTRNFENALKHATGDYFFLSDQDDVWLDGRVDACMEKLKTSNFIMTDGYITDEYLNKQSKTHFEKHSVRQGFFNNWVKTRYVGAFMAFDKEVYNFIIPFPKNQFYAPHDYWITISSELYFKCHLINEPYILYRRHNSNVTGQRKGRTLSIVVKQRVYTLAQVIIRRLKKNG